MLTGPLTSTGIHANAILTSSQQKMSGNLMWPDLHLTLYGMSHHATMDQEFVDMFNLEPEVADQYFKNTKGQDSFSIIISAGRPFSRGNVRLVDSNINSDPVINPKYFSDPRDTDVMMDGIYRALSLIENSVSFRVMGASLTSEPFPSCAEFEFKTKSYWACYLKYFTMSGNNLVGTCAMGVKASSGGGGGQAVVDGDLKVLGVNGLRIIDASVMPSIPVGGTLAATMVIAEKGVDIIRNYWDEVEMMSVNASRVQKMGN